VIKAINRANIQTNLNTQEPRNTHHHPVRLPNKAATLPPQTMEEVLLNTNNTLPKTNTPNSQTTADHPLPTASSSKGPLIPAAHNNPNTANSLNTAITAKAPRVLISEVPAAQAAQTARRASARR